ncbi:MAG: citrate/2-methylcitrate synthase, partial [Gemmatimonadota bacterium]
VLAAFDRLRKGAEPVPPDPARGHAADFLRMLTGEDPDEQAVRAVDGALILLADHGLNASTFTARVVASTLGDLHSAIVSAIGALRGPLHGGAAEAVMRMLLEIAEPENAEAYVKARLDRHEKVMGFGHRVYRTEDPRATHLRRWSRELGERFGRPKWFEISRRIEEVMAREKALDSNVDFYSASVYYALDIPVDLYTPIFACSRVVGWSAHVLEQYADNRLIRPRAEYVGPGPRPYVTVDER